MACAVQSIATPWDSERSDSCRISGGLFIGAASPRTPWCGTLGSRSYGRPVQFKADVVNAFVAREQIQSISEFDVGDGDQLAKYSRHIAHRIASSPMIFPAGVGGALYPPGHLHPDVLDEATFRALCPSTDDAWL